MLNIEVNGRAYTKWRNGEVAERHLAINTPEVNMLITAYKFLICYFIFQVKRILRTLIFRFLSEPN